MTLPDLLLALCANFAWAFNFIAGKAGVTHFPPLLFTSLRFGLLFLLLLPFLRWLPGRMVAVFQVAVLLGVLHFGLMFAGLAVSGDIASVAIATQLYVPFAALLAAWWLRERLNRQRLLGIGLAFGGVLVVGFDPIVLQHPAALALITAAALVMALATIMMRRLPGIGVFNLQAWIALISFPCHALLSLLLESGQWQAIQSATWLEFATPAYSAVGASLVGHGIVYYLLGRYPVSVTTPIMLLTPVLAVVLGVTLWGDTLTWKLLLGGAMTLVGVGIVQWRPAVAHGIAVTTARALAETGR